MRLLGFTAVYATLATLGLVLLRRALDDASVGEIARTPTFYVGGALYAASFGTFLLSLRHFEVLTVFPVFTGVAYATVTLASTLVLDESLSGGRLAGIACVALGVVLLVR